MEALTGTGDWERLPSLQLNIYDSHNKIGTFRVLPENRFTANLPAPLTGLSEKGNGRHRWENLICGVDIV